MYYLLKNTLNFDSFKNIKLDLINKIETSDISNSHEENEVFNFLKDKEMSAEELNFSKQRNLKNTLSMEKKLKHINSLKKYLNDITNIRYNEKSSSYKSKKKALSEGNLNVYSILEDFYNYENKTTQILKNEKNMKTVILHDIFYETLHKKIEKNGFIKKQFIKNFLLKYVSKKYKNNTMKCILITNKIVINGKLNIYIQCFDKFIIGKDNNNKNTMIYLEKNIYKMLIKKKLNFVKNNRKLKNCLKLLLERNNIRTNKVRYAMKEIYLKKKLCLKNINYIFNKYEKYLSNSTNNHGNIDMMREANITLPLMDKQGLHAYNQNEFSNMHKLEVTHIYGNGNNLKARNSTNAINVDMNSNKNEKHISRISLFKKSNEVFEINNLKDSINKNVFNQKNINLSIIRRMSTNNHRINKNHVKKNKDKNFHFLSNNINFYETLIKRSKCKENYFVKDNTFSDKNIIQNREINEIKEKIKTTLIGLNNIKKKNYKLKFCLEKEIIDNTIHHNELKRSITSLFNENTLQNKNGKTVKHPKNKKKSTNTSNSRQKYIEMGVKGNGEYTSNESNQIVNINLKTNVDCIYNKIKNENTNWKKYIENKTDEQEIFFNNFNADEFLERKCTQLEREEYLKDTNNKINKKKYILNKNELNENNLINKRNINTCKLVCEQKSDMIKDDERKLYNKIEVKPDNNFINKLKNKDKKEVIDNVENYEKGITHDNMENDENEYPSSEYKGEDILINNIKNNNDTLISDKKNMTQNTINCNNFTKSFTSLKNMLPSSYKTTKEEFDIKNVRYIKKIINCEIYINSKFEKINERNKNAINIIEKYLNNRNRKTHIDFTKQKEGNTCFKTNYIFENTKNEKKVKLLPNLYDHYACLLLNLKNSKVI
ncbi:conserved Plasmodium protein, unknown function [Plasmodium berghei]|uniref:Uncharacterized protein n=2 Tax=Plasmodium berghei TaxID=5821 RepID=A0A509AIC0_PLABA|nr:conserved Plasmodium protein, unknown function [Plasmodium berghei ANKA]CXI03156.1 conserved Plasmodium protein, unknown function [Plasmodium berghei]SCL92064.1 conserved Plasmodium protein, unknown function [Plasmodium berghei]SCM15586.1 conserved Plasmodium protein, unknown function [Plasmodium berghei]SCM17378.1 conserved Plasmodium protein, unknown function [Plasmodium berghei]SCN22629.1 conserved Plasmodium protein, unknown function [Plasmodium berghei]|eukprot:XP_034420184.1 conserved Plasmodium protein, unknown function [Plasmodium berghei ANKA]